MSHASHGKAVRNASLPLAHRMSHARSCVNHVAARLGVEREFLLNEVLRITGVDLRILANETEMMRAFEAMEKLSVADIQRS